MEDREEERTIARKGEQRGKHKQSGGQSADRRVTVYIRGGDSIEVWYKALATGASQQGLGLEPYEWHWTTRVRVSRLVARAPIG